MIYLTLVTFSVFFAEACGLCNWPCYWQNRVWYNSQNDWYLSVGTSTYELLVNGTVIATGECFQKHGPFIIFRFPQWGSHECVKLSYYAEDMFITHGTSPLPPDVSPDLCDICSSIEVTSESLKVWVELGCDTPKNCPSGYGDIPCTGCEKGVPDNGYCCQDNVVYQERYAKRPVNENDYVKQPTKPTNVFQEKKTTYGGYGYHHARVLDTYNPSNP